MSGLLPSIGGSVGDVDDEVVVLVGLGLVEGKGSALSDWLCMSRMQCTWSHTYN